MLCGSEGGAGVDASEPGVTGIAADALFSVIVPVWRPDPDHLMACIKSVVEQTCDRWELLLIVNGDQPGLVDAVLDSWDWHERIDVIRLAQNLGISQASQVGLDRASAEFIALLDHDDMLSEHALGAFAAEINRFGEVDLAYSDEDKLDAMTGRRKMPFYKPAFSMERLRCQMYLGHMLVIRRSLAVDVGGFRSSFDGAQDHDLALRVAERARTVVHLPRILYHWRESQRSTALKPDTKNWAWEAGPRAVEDHLKRTGFPATARPHPSGLGVTRLVPQLADPPLVSIIVPTGGTRRPINGLDSVLIQRAVATVTKNTAYPNYELVVVTDNQADAELASSVGAARLPRSADPCGPVPDLNVVADDQPFNFARACNLGAVHSNGDVLVFLNDDVEIVRPEWLDRMVMYATRPEIGATGLKLLYSDGRIQHGGVWSRAGGPAHRYVGYAGDHPGNFNALHLAQNCLAVTAACLAIERSKFEQVGGFCMLFPLAYNDVDLCLKLHRLGYRNVVDCDNDVVHHESSTRDPTVRDWELDLLFRRWRPVLTADPYDNPCNLAAGVEEFPPTPIDVAESKAYRYQEIDVSGRVWTTLVPANNGSHGETGAMVDDA